MVRHATMRCKGSTGPRSDFGQFTRALDSTGVMQRRAFIRPMKRSTPVVETGTWRLPPKRSYFSTSRHRYPGCDQRDSQADVEPASCHRLAPITAGELAQGEGCVLTAQRRKRWFPIAWSVLAFLCLWLTVATALDPDGPWWVPLTFGGCTLVAAGSVVSWLRENGKRNRPT
jgi:hypothetical protein